MAVKYTHNFSDDPNYYELRLPYVTSTDNNSCEVKLRDAKVNLYNDFSKIATIIIYLNVKTRANRQSFLYQR